MHIEGHCMGKLDGRCYSYYRLVHYCREGFEMDSQARWPGSGQELIQVCADIQDAANLEQQVRALELQPVDIRRSHALRSRWSQNRYDACLKRFGLTTPGSGCCSERLVPAHMPQARHSPTRRQDGLHPDER